MKTMSEHAYHSEDATDYHAYLLRLWREEGGDWRVSLQSTRTGERYGFADLQMAVQFVEQNLGQGKLNENNDGKQMA